MTIAVSTDWNAQRHAGWAGAVGELLALGVESVALDGPALHPDGAAVRRALRDAHGELVALFAPAPPRDEMGRPSSEGLVSPRPEKRALAIAAALAAAQAAKDAGTGLVVLRAGELPDLDPARERRWLERLVREGRTPELVAEVRANSDAARRDRERFVDALCRSLFDLARAERDVTWLVETPARTCGLPDPAEMDAVLGELPGRRIGYWHDAAHAAALDALGAVPAQEWLARLGSRTAGISISDWSPMSGRLPPGAGVVDWAALRAQVGSATARVLRLAPALPAALLGDALREAQALGF